MHNNAPDQTHSRTLHYILEVMDNTVSEVLGVMVMDNTPL